MIDQLHAFPNQAAADAAFPRPVDDEGSPINAPCWMAGAATIMPVTVYVMDGETIRPSTETWIGVSMPDDDADMFWDMASAAVELSPPATSAFWTTCVTRSRIAPEAAGAVMGVSPVFAGRGYLFPEWPDAEA